MPTPSARLTSSNAGRLALLEQPEVGQHDRVVEAQDSRPGRRTPPSSATSWPTQRAELLGGGEQVQVAGGDRGDGDRAGGQQRHPAADAGGERRRLVDVGAVDLLDVAGHGRAHRLGTGSRWSASRSVIWNTLPLHGTLAVPTFGSQEVLVSRRSLRSLLNHRARRQEMGVLRLAHVDVRTPDLELSTAYYTEVLGLQRLDAHRRRGLPQVLGRGGPPLAAAALRLPDRAWTCSPSASRRRTTSPSSRSRLEPRRLPRRADVSRGDEVGQGESIRFEIPSRPDHGAGLGPREGRQHPGQAQPLAGAAAGPARHRAAAHRPHAHQRRGGRRVATRSSRRCSASG